MPLKMDQIQREGIESLLLWATSELESLGPDEARASAEWLLAEVLGMARSAIHVEKKVFISKDQIENFKAFVQNRKKRKPLSYIIGKAHFRDEVLGVGPSCLIPRPETELLIEKFIDNSKIHQEDIFSFLDLGTGSGAISVSLLRYYENAQATLADISKGALDIAESNLARYDLLSRGELVHSDLFESLQGRKWNVIVSNPPYVAEKDYQYLEPELLFEPREALYGGKDGLDFYRRIIKKAPRFLTFRGWICLEVGFKQAGQVKALLKDSGFINIESYKDYSGIDRVVMAQISN